MDTQKARWRLSGVGGRLVRGTKRLFLFSKNQVIMDIRREVDNKIGHKDSR